MERIEKLRGLLAQNPADNFVQHALALEYVKLGRDDEAQRLFEGLLARDEKYIGSYYHLAKLLERRGEGEMAIGIYEKGMKVAKEVGDGHAYRELMAALEDLTE